MPWSSPLKIIVQSSEVINDATINRGLLNLLNNDYYLDLKTQAINNFIQTNIISHIQDNSIHISREEILDILGSASVLQKDSIIKVPVMYNEIDNSTNNDISIDISIEKINQILDMAPKNLNGHILVIKFVYGGTVATIGNTQVKTNRLPICFNGFSNGTLIICSDTSDVLPYNSYDDLDNLAVIDDFMSSDTNINSIVQAIFNSFNSDEQFKGNDHFFTFAGNGINKYYSSFLISDCTSDIYLTSCTIKNTLSAFTNDAISAARQLNNNNLPNKDDVLAVFLCNKYESPNNIIAKQNYTNFTAFPNNVSFDIKTKKDNISSLFLSDAKNTWLDLNKNISNYNSPDYLQFTNTDNTYTIDNIIRQYLYNWNNNNNNFSICFFGNISSIVPNKHAVLFSDYNVNPINNKQQGLYVYLDQTYGYFTTNNKIGDPNYNTYNSNILTNNIENKDCFYVIDFITHGTSDTLSSLDRAPYRLIDNAVFSTSTTCSSYWNLQQGKMRINLTIYPCITSDNGYLSQNGILAIPNMNLSTENFSQTSRYTFDIPIQDLSKFNYPIYMFGNKINYSTDESLYNWNYFNGKIRNIMFFKKLLSDKQIKSFINKGITTVYDWPNINDQNIIDNITTESYIGALNIYNSNHVNLIHTQISTSAIVN